MSSTDALHVKPDRSHGCPSGSDCSYDETDLEQGEREGKSHGKEVQAKDCRICHLGLDMVTDSDNSFDRVTTHQAIMELGCSCKGDLGAAHKKCAEDWFKIKGNTICEICGTSAANIKGVNPQGVHSMSGGASSGTSAPVMLIENNTFWHSRRIMNLLLACMAVAFVVSWLFHFKVLH